MVLCRKVAAAAALALVAAGAVAQDTGGLARQLMVRSGLDRQLEAYPALVQAGMEESRARSGLSDDRFAELKEASVKAFDPAALKRVVQRELARRLAPKDIEAALAWLDAPLGRRITQLEEQASTAEAFAAMQAWAGALRPGDLAEARIAQARRLDRAIKATEFSVSSARNSQLAIIAAMTATLPAADQRQALDAVVAAFEQNRAQIRASAEQQTVMSMLYSYRALGDAELDRYIAFAESAAGRKYHAAALEALDQAIVEASRDAGRIIMERLRQQKAAGGQRAAA